MAASKRLTFLNCGERLFKLYAEEHPEIIGQTDSKGVRKFFRSNDWKESSQIFRYILQQMYDNGLPTSWVTGVGAGTINLLNAEEEFDAYMEE